ncbi:MAG: hypothetical protein ACI9K5_003699 [Gammaproteobacteria bacterium]|jgi:hypothetical protein
MRTTHFKSLAHPVMLHVVAGIALLLPFAMAIPGEQALADLWLAEASKSELVAHTAQLFDLIGPIVCLGIAIALAVEV